MPTKIKNRSVLSVDLQAVAVKVEWTGYYPNRAHLGAFMKGWRANRSGAGRRSCPYDDKRGPRGSVTWARAYEKAWRFGWDVAEDNPAYSYRP